jgi:hypothetical protein
MKIGAREVRGRLAAMFADTKVQEKSYVSD